MSQRRLHQEERVLWQRVIDTVKPLHPLKVALHATPVVEPAAPVKTAAAKSPAPSLGAAGQRRAEAKKTPLPPPIVEGSLDSHWDRRFQKGAIIPDISIDLHGHGLAGAHARLDHMLDQAIRQNLRVLLLVTGKPRGHDRASGQGRGAIASVVRDWLASSRHAAHIASVRQAHPRHGGEGALYIVLKR